MDSSRLALADNLRRYRKQAGLTQDALADAAGLHRNAIGLLEQGRRDPRVSTVAALSRALTEASSEPVSVADLLAGVK